MDSPRLFWSEKRFSELDRQELYAILAARAEVFVVEQNCPYQDVDGLDQDSIHIMASDSGGRVLAYCRITPPGSRFVEPSVGRVLTTAAGRGTGVGRRLMEHSIDACRRHFPGQAVRISAQQYLQAFYGSLGFGVVHGPYEEDGIPHLEMLLPASKQGEG